MCIAESVRAASFSFTGAFAPDLQIAGFSRNECRTLYELLWLKASPEVTRKGLEALGGSRGSGAGAWHGGAHGQGARLGPGARGFNNRGFLKPECP